MPKVNVVLRAQDYCSRSEDKQTFCKDDDCECETSCVANGHPLLGMIIHASAVSLSKFRVLTRKCRVGSAGYGLNNVPLIFELRLSLRRHSGEFPAAHLRLDPSFPSLRTCGCFPACTHFYLRIFQILLHNLQTVFLCFSEWCFAL